MKLATLTVPLAALALTACASGDQARPGEPPTEWSAADLPALDDRTYLVTGGTSGIGYEAARALAKAGAHVVIAARDPVERGNEVIASILLDAPDARVDYQRFDLASLASVRALADQLQVSLPKLDGLINNAGIMEPPERGTSAEGYESQFAINYLGHFVLTAELLPLLRRSDAPRVVTQSSLAAGRGSLHFDDLQFTRDYDAAAAYGQSKLACLMFALELQRRSDVEGWGIQSMASHPGLSRTNLNAGLAFRRVLPFLFQSAEQGATPAVFAAAAPEARGGTYYGPSDFLGTRGPVGIAEVPEAALQPDDAARLWSLSEELSGTSFPPSSAFDTSAGAQIPLITSGVVR